MKYSDFKIANEGLVDSAIGAAAGLAVATIPFIILGIPLHMRNKAQAKTRKEDLIKYFTAKGISTDPKDIETYIGTTRDKIARRCLEYAKKIESAAKFKFEAEKSIKASMAAYEKENDDNEYPREWTKYHPNEVSFAPFMTKGINTDLAIVLVARNGKLESRIYKEEDADDNAPEYYRSILDPIVKPVADAIITKVKQEFADDIAAGLVELEYLDTDVYDLPCIAVTGAAVPKIKGWNK